MRDEMLEITIKLVPFGDYSYDKNLAKIMIINDASGTKEKGNYVVKFLGESSTVGEPNAFTFRIKGYKKDQGYLKLVNKAIKKATSIKEKQKCEEK